MSKVEKVKDYVVPKVRWYLKYRTSLLVTGSLLIGLFGGNVDRITKWIPTLKHDTSTIEKQIEELKQIEKSFKDIQKRLDDLTKSKNGV